MPERIAAARKAIHDRLIVCQQGNRAETDRLERSVRALVVLESESSVWSSG
jgi:hypothetical protein